LTFIVQIIRILNIYKAISLKNIYKVTCNFVELTNNGSKMGEFSFIPKKKIFPIEVVKVFSLCTNALSLCVLKSNLCRGADHSLSWRRGTTALSLSSAMAY
jgi:hypothetical protein